MTQDRAQKNINRIAYRYRMEWYQHGKHGRRIRYWVGVRDWIRHENNNHKR